LTTLTLPSEDTFSPFAETIFKQKYAQPGEEWRDTARRVVETVMKPYFPELVEEMVEAVAARKFMPGGRYLYATGKRFHQTQNCLLLKVEDSRESIADLLQRVSSGLMTGAGIGIVWSALRPNGAKVEGMGGTSTGPIAFMQMVNEVGRHIMQGGARRSAIWAGLHWNHEDVFDFIRLKDWSDDIKAAKEKDFNAYAPMDGTNISVILDDDFFAAYENPIDPMHDWAQKVYWEVVEHMLTTAEPGFSIDVGENAGEHLRNACTEVTSRDDNDICNLGSINLARLHTKEEFARLVELGTAFLLAGTCYSLVPYERVAETRTKNRRLGLGLMGIYEWLVARGYRYEENEELANWLDIYARSTEIAARYAARLGISAPVKTRAIAPTGTIGILAETTTGIEPLFAVAFKRRYLKGKEWYYQYVVDATAKRLIEKYNLDPEEIETAYDLAKDPEARIAFQAWVQQWVDHGISSTLNLPAVDQQEFTHQEFGEMLFFYLPKLRGVTAYPDGSRGGQPLTVVPFWEADGAEGIEYEEIGADSACVGGVCGV
jgi:ribonucleoside-diphosphate reductase alpha chain